MADRTSAELFGMFFGLLAENPSNEHIEMAKRVWKWASRYDFCEYQMEADDVLIALDLAKEGKEGIIYFGEEGFEDA